MGAVRMRVNVLWSEKLCVCKKQIHHFWGILMLNQNTSPKVIHNNVSSSEKISCLNAYLFTFVYIYLDCFQL